MENKDFISNPHKLLGGSDLQYKVKSLSPISHDMNRRKKNAKERKRLAEKIRKKEEGLGTFSLVLQSNSIRFLLLVLM